MLKTVIKMLTPFIISVADIVCGVILFLRVKYEYDIPLLYRELLSHITGSSLLVIGYIIVSSKHMCKYYKASCYSLMLFHIMAIVYIITPMSAMSYIYSIWIFSTLSLVLWTISVLGHKTYKTISQACKHSEIE